jgi:hypothetical protein
MSVIDVLQWFACGATLLSTYLHGRVNKMGPAIAVVSAVLFMTINICAGLYIVAGVSALSVILNSRNFFLWRKS